MTPVILNGCPLELPGCLSARHHRPTLESGEFGDLMGWEKKQLESWRSKCGVSWSSWSMSKDECISLYVSPKWKDQSIPSYTNSLDSAINLDSLKSCEGDPFLFAVCWCDHASISSKIRQGKNANRRCFISWTSSQKSFMPTNPSEIGWREAKSPPVDPCSRSLPGVCCTIVIQE